MKTDLYYVQQVKNGKVEAFSELVRRYDRLVFTSIVKILNRREVAEDMAQEVFFKAYQNLDKFREESEFSTWLYRIAYNTAISELRKKKNYRLAINDNYDNIEDADIVEEIEEHTLEQQMEWLEEILNQMPQEDALIVTLFYLNEQSIKQISDITGYSVANVKVKLHRIRKYMNLEMNKLIGNE